MDLTKLELITAKMIPFEAHIQTMENLIDEYKEFKTLDKKEKLGYQKKMIATAAKLIFFSVATEEDTVDGLMKTVDDIQERKDFTDKVFGKGDKNNN